MDEDGKLVLYPGSGAETFKMANNSTSTIAALQTIIKRLMELPATYLTSGEKMRLTAYQTGSPGSAMLSLMGMLQLLPPNHGKE